MSFTDALNCARRFRFPDVPKGRYSSLDDFYAEVVAPQEIDLDVLRGWTELLCRYVEEETAIVFVRKLERQERRGFRTMFDGGFSYVFSDNTLATVIYAMARLKIVPAYADFRDYIFERQALPLSMRPNGAEKTGFSAFPWYGHPGGRRGQNGWKLAHINDINNAGEYLVDYEQFQRSYYVPGTLRDWEIDPIEGPIRRFGDIQACDRKVFKAHFLRFCNPLNYFLSPNSNSHELLINGVKYGRGVSEYNAMRRFIGQKRQEAFGGLYDDYLRMILSSGIALPRGEEVMIFTHPPRNRPVGSPNAPRRAQPVRLNNGNAANVNKTVNRMARWAENPRCKPHRIIRAFLACCDENRIAEIGDLRLLCNDPIIHPDMRVESFDACFSSMKTNAGHSYGLVFVQDGTHIRLHPDVLGLIDLFA